MRSSSCAHTAAAQVTVRTPSRSARGARGGGDRGAGGALPDLLHPRERARRRERAGELVQRGGEGAGATLLTPAIASCRIAPGRDAQARHGGVHRAGDVGEVRCRYDALAAHAQLVGKQLAALAVELAHDVVEQHQRRAAAFAGEHRALGQQQRQQRQTLLTLGAVDAQLAPVAQDRELVAVRSMRRRSHARGRRAGARAARPANSSSPTARERGRYSSVDLGRRTRAAPARSANGSASRATAAARWARSSSARLASSRSHVESVACEARAERMRPSSALRWASTREYSPAGVRARRPDGGDHLVEVGSAEGRRPLHELETIGQEDAHERPDVDVEQALDGGSVGGHPLDRHDGMPARPRRSEAHAQLVRRARRRGVARRRAPPGRRSARARDRCAVRGERAVQPKYSASSRFDLPAPFGPWTTVRPSPRRASRAGVACGSRAAAR